MRRATYDKRRPKEKLLPLTSFTRQDGRAETECVWFVFRSPCAFLAPDLTVCQSVPGVIVNSDKKTERERERDKSVFICVPCVGDTLVPPSL